MAPSVIQFRKKYFDFKTLKRNENRKLFVGDYIKTMKTTILFKL